MLLVWAKSLWLVASSTGFAIVQNCIHVRRLIPSRRCPSLLKLDSQHAKSDGARFPRSGSTSVLSRTAPWMQAEDQSFQSCQCSGFMELEQSCHTYYDDFGELLSAKCRRISAFWDVETPKYSMSVG